MQYKYVVWVVIFNKNNQYIYIFFFTFLKKTLTRGEKNHVIYCPVNKKDFQ